MFHIYLVPFFTFCTLSCSWALAAWMGLGCCSFATGEKPASLKKELIYSSVSNGAEDFDSPLLLREYIPHCLCP